MVPDFVFEIVCIPIAIAAVTLYVVVVAIDTTCRDVFGEVCRRGHI